MSTFFSHLECSVPCGAGPYDARHLHTRCSCGAPLLARYDLTGAKRWPKTSLPGREASMWRYREIMPLLDGDRGPDAPVTLGEGWTPLLRARRLGKRLGLERLYIKDEAVNPTSSVSARGLSVAATRALHLGLRALSISTSGSAGPACAAYASRAGLEAKVFVPRDTRASFVRASELAGAEITHVDGSAADAMQAAAEAGAAHAWHDASSLHEPYRLEGNKTIGYEIAEQLAWQLPDWVVFPAGTGAGVIGFWKACAEMAALGWVDPVRRPHLAAAQAAGCAPLVRAFASGADKAAPWENPQTVADELRITETIGDFLVMRALRESGGAAVSAGDAEMVAAMKDYGRNEGVSAGPESGAALHVLRVLMNDGRVKPHDTVVVINTSGALHYMDLVG